MEINNPADVTAQAAAPAQTGNAPTADTIASMIAANRATRPAVENASVPPGGQPAKQEPQAATEESAAEPEDQTTEHQEQQGEEHTEQAGDTATEAVDFLAFAEQNPEMKFRIPNKNAPGGFVEIDAKKLGSIVGQGSAIHQKAEALKTQQEQFAQYEAQRKQELDGLQIGLELTVVPQLENLTQEVVQLHQYNHEWKALLDKATNEEERLEALAGIKQNEKLIKEKSQVIQSTRPKVEQFFKARAEQVGKMLNHAVENYRDKSLQKEVGGIREQLSKSWASYNQALVPGVANIDLITADEGLMSLVRDGLKFRAGPKSVKNTGGSIAATGKVLTSKGVTTQKSDVSELQEKAAKGDKSAQHNLLAAMLAANKRRR